MLIWVSRNEDVVGSVWNWVYVGDEEMKLFIDEDDEASS